MSERQHTIDQEDFVVLSALWRRLSRKRKTRVAEMMPSIDVVGFHIDPKLVIAIVLTVQ